MLRRLHPDQPESFAFTPGNQAWAEKQMTKFPEGRQASAVIPLLWRAQEQEGWVTKPAIETIADMLGMAYIRVLEVVSFYFMFQMQPVGSVAHIQVCGTTTCMICGAEDLIAVCKEKIAPAAHVISENGKFSWEEVECLGACTNAPMVQIGKDFYEDLTADNFKDILDAFAKGEVPTPGPQNGRFAAEPLTGLTSLKEFDSGSHSHNASAALALDYGDTIKRIQGDEVPVISDAGAGKKQDAADKAAQEKTAAAKVAADKAAKEEAAADKAAKEDAAAADAAADMVAKEEAAASNAAADKVEKEEAVAKAAAEKAAQREAAAAEKAAQREAAAAEKAAQREAAAAEKAAQKEAAAAKATAEKAAQKEAAAAKAAADKAAKQEAAAAKAAADNAAKEDETETPRVGTRPQALAQPRDGGPDDLKMIKGVGPKMEVLLNNLGFYHFDQVASWTTDEVAWVDENLEGSRGRVSRDEWVKQAKTLAAGGETEFSKKVDEGGVY